jgi:hypothetical protein
LSITDAEGLDDDEDFEQLIDGVVLTDREDDLLGNHISWSTSFVTTLYGDIDGTTAIDKLNSRSIFHVISKSPIFCALPTQVSLAAREKSMPNRYSSGVFMGILIDTGALYVQLPEETNLWPSSDYS